MNKRTFLQFLDSQKFPAFPFVVGFGVACIHFVITYRLVSESSFSVLVHILTAPGRAIEVLPYFIFHAFSGFHISDFQIVLASSLFYGIMGGVFVSKKKYARLLGNILIFLLICFWWFTLFLFGSSS